MDEQSPEATDETVPLRTKVIASVVGVLVLLGAAAALMHFESPAISPDQAAPSGHYAASCGLCHTVSSDAPNIGVR
jgi:hypothetical protein